jgi:DHA1 family bicyclomycin/chloramphenicol resistance-like MFS transporter
MQTFRMLPPGSRGFVLILGALSSMAPVATDMNLPALPTLTAVFRTSPERVQLTLSVFLIGFGAGQLVHGPASDRFGRRPVLLVGLALFALAGYGCAVSASIVQLVAFRLLQGLGAAAGPVLARAMVRDFFSGAPAARLLSYIALVQGLGPLLAPIAGGLVLARIGWHAIFLAQAIAATAVLAAVWRWLGESRPIRDATATSVRGLARSYRRFLGTALCVRYAVMIALVFGGLFAYISNSPFVFIQVFGVRSDRYGFVFAVTAFSLMVAAFTNGRLVRHFAPDAVLRAGVALVGVGGGALLVCVLARAGGIPGIVLPMVVYAFGFGLVMPNATAAALEPYPDMAGVASSLVGFFQMAGGALVGYLVNALYTGTPLAMAVCIAAMAALTAIVHVVGDPRRRPAYARRPPPR